MRVEGPFKKLGCLATAQRTSLQSLQGMWDRAEREKLFFRCKWSGRTFTPKQLIKAMKSGQWIRGPQCWHLIDEERR